MKVCFIIVGRLSLSPRAIREIDSLSKHFDLNVIEFYKTPRLPANSISKKIQITPILPAMWLSSNLLNLPLVLLTLLPPILKSKADIYHCYGFLELIAGFLAKMLTGKKLIYDAYEIYPYQFSPKESEEIISRIKKFLIWNLVYAFENLFLHFTDCVLTVPSFNDELLRRYQKHHRSVFVIWNVPNPDFLEV